MNKTTLLCAVLMLILSLASCNAAKNGDGTADTTTPAAQTTANESTKAPADTAEYVIDPIIFDDFGLEGVYERDEAGRPVLWKYSGGYISRCEFEYSGERITEKRTYYVAAGGEEFGFERNAYEYDGEGRISKSTFYDINGERFTHTVYEYGGGKGHIRATTYDAAGEIYSTVENEYSEDGVLITMRSEIAVSGITVERRYDAESGIIMTEETFRSAGGEYYLSSSKEYNEKGDETLCRNYTPDGQLSYEGVYTYLEDGKLHREQYFNGDGTVSVEESRYDPAGRVTQRCVLDKDGNIILRSVFEYEGDSLDPSKRTDYDSSGSVISETELDSNVPMPFAD